MSASGATGLRPFDRPYLLLSLASLFWAGNIVLGRFIADHIPPVALTWTRWVGAFILLALVARRDLLRDLPALRSRWPQLVGLSALGVAGYTVLAYWALHYTQALNALLAQSVTPLVIGVWSFALYRDALTPRQAVGVVVSLAGVATIVTRGDLGALARIDVNLGDLIFMVAIALYALYSTLLRDKPKVAQTSLLTALMALAAILLTPALLWEIAQGRTMSFDAVSLGSLAYVIVFPSTLGYLFYNRGVELIGANRAGPFFHLIPLFGAALAILLLGERPQAYHAVGFALVLAGVWTAARSGPARG